MNQIICAKKHISSHPTVIPCALSLSLLATNVKKSNDCSLSKVNLAWHSNKWYFPLIKLIKKQILQCSLTFNAILYSAMCWFSILLVGLFWKNLFLSFLLDSVKGYLYSFRMGKVGYGGVLPVWLLCCRILIHLLPVPIFDHFLRVANPYRFSWIRIRIRHVNLIDYIRIRMFSIRCSFSVLLLRFRHRLQIFTNNPKIKVKPTCTGT